MMSLCSQVQDDTGDRVIICTEDISKDHKITTSEILSHAEKLGVDYITEFELLPLVLNGLIHPLPVNWIPCFDNQLQEFFYYNLESGTSQWEHPIDEQYKNLIFKIKNEYGGNLNKFLRSNENSDNMLPLRQNRKPQLLPIKQLLRYKDEEKSATTDDKIVKYDLHSSLRTRIDSSPYKKSVSFVTNESVPEKDSQSHNTEYEIGTNEIALNKDNWIPESIDPLWENSDLTRKPEISPLSRNLNKKIFSLKQSFNEIKSNSGSQVSNNLKRLHINLRQPDSLMFSESNHDDTIKNILSASPTSELISEEEESAHNMLTNESGIDVNTVTDLQKLKARSKLNNPSIDMDKQISGVIDVSLRKAIAEVEKNLNSKIESMITEEITKLKKFERDRLESNFDDSIYIKKQSNYETRVNEIRESFKIFQEEIERKVEENHIVLKEFQNAYNLEISELRENMKQNFSFFETKHECFNNTENCQKVLQNLIEERLSTIEQSFVKKMETFETANKRKWEEFRMEKGGKLTELDEKFRTFVEENRNNSAKLWQESLEIIVQRVLNELFVKMSNNDPILLNFEKIIFNILNKQQTKKSESADKKSAFTQTESTTNSKEIVMWKENINEICSTVKSLFEETLFSKKSNNEQVSEEDLDELFLSKNVKKINYPTLVQVPVNMESYKTDFNSFEEFSSHIDEELDFYRNKYLSSSKWCNIKRNKEK